jgi:hypothetical protein
MGINVSFITIEDEEYIRYEDYEGAKLWLPKNKSKKAYESLIGQLKHIYGA